ncbi:MFS transporter [Peribacillus castrilensis]|uniref:MFS transporter n=1 Tax=Bacillaceae TaxID=186817 RepID=UPI00065FC852|nr:MULTISPECIES: MFS transporter [Bacillaceae]MCP1092356.1 MFS transporter [Bacillaceae bacterium OS4b]MBD8588699.1 MFS transporter [Peribacillus simplex]MCF7624313.1 MFS transporter [Peribacillus frigoritolerans]MCP1154875.1 MFS transporter [Peribacillus frigoritolerans]MCT1388246.1 MFS transporter [Peribacillus frigoritolerans]
MQKQNNLLIFILTIGVFGIINTEMGVIGILPSIADHFHVSISKAGLLVSLFALAVAVSGPTMPLLFSGMNRKKVMLLVLGVFVLGNIVSIFTTNFTLALVARIVPAFFHPIYCSLAFTVAADSVSKEEAPKAVSKVFIGVSAGMVVGVPIVSFIANAASIEMAMAFFAIVNAIVFLATLIFVPSMPVEEKLSYGAQLSVLKKSITWLSIVAVILLNSAVFGVYSYLTEYLKTVTNMSSNTISLMLLIYGGANIIGNIAAGKLLTKNANKSVVIFPFALGAVYIILFLFGQFTIPMAILTLIWGILAGIGGNINQYWIMSSAPESPDFANGLFLTAVNLGTTIGAAAGGLFISELGTQYVVFVGLLSLLLSSVMIFLRNYKFTPTQQLS